MIVAALVATDLGAQAPATKPGYPSPPRSLGEAEEIALAMTAAPEEISSKADVYVIRGTEFVKARIGTNGCSCMVGRDLHEGSRYPICFDQEGSRTTLLRELKESTLRAQGRSEDEVKRAVEAAYASGELRSADQTRDGVHDVAAAGALLLTARRRRSCRAVVATPHAAHARRCTRATRLDRAIEGGRHSDPPRRRPPRRVDRESAGLVGRKTGRPRREALIGRLPAGNGVRFFSP